MDQQKQGYQRFRGRMLPLEEEWPPLMRAPKEVAVVWYLSADRSLLLLLGCSVLPSFYRSSQGKARVWRSLKQKVGSLNRPSPSHTPKPMMFFSCFSVNSTFSTLFNTTFSLLIYYDSSFMISLSFSCSLYIWKISLEAALYFFLSSFSNSFISFTSSSRLLQFFYMKLSFCSLRFLSYLYFKGSSLGLEMNCYYSFFILFISSFFSSQAYFVILRFSSIKRSRLGWSSFWISLRAPLRRLIQDSYSLRSASLGSRLMMGTLVMYFALEAYLSVEIVYSQLQLEGETVAIITVFALPPKESCRRRVSLESRQGMKEPLPSTSTEITLPKAVRERLIFVAQRNLYPTEPVLLCLSEPARSTRLNFDPTSFSIFSGLFSSDSTQMVKMECDRDDSLFMSVSPVVLFWLPILRYFIISAIVVIGIFLISLMKTPFYGDSLSSSFPFSFMCSRSLSSSLYSSMYEHMIRKSLDLSALADSRIDQKHLGMMPFSSSFFSSPIIVQVLPEPVCPQAKTVPLYPCNTSLVRCLLVASQISFCEALGSKISSKENVFVLFLQELMSRTVSCFYPWSLDRKSVLPISKGEYPWPSTSP